LKENAMPRPVAYAFGLLIVGLLVAGPLWFRSHWFARFRNFHVVREGVLYRSGQLTLDGFKEVLEDNRIRSVVTLRDSRRNPGAPPPDSPEEAYCKAHHIRHFRLPPVAWSAADGSVPATRQVRRFLEVMRDPDNYPVLIHCLAGKHRTGAYCALYRMEIEHWTNAEAIAEMKYFGYDNLEEHEDLESYLKGFRPAWAGITSPPAAPGLASEASAPGSPSAAQ
jgi:tyrosine-protein phosphatase SIW14